PGVELMRSIREIDAESLRSYPDAGELERAIAKRWGVAPERIVVTNGGDDAIDRTCRATLEPGRNLVSHTPTFEMIPRVARLAGATVRATRWVDDGFPTESIRSAIDDQTGLVAVVSPNNPTGGAAPVDAIHLLSTAARRVGAAFLVDLAYAEFADSDPTPDLLALDNAVIVRTFSKAFGLAGLRVGYAIAPPPISEWLRTTGGPYPVSGPSLALALHALAGHAGVPEAHVRRVREERAGLTSRLRSRGVRTIPSQANFVAAYVGDARAVRDRLLDRGIAVRAFEGGGDLEGLVRITLPGDPVAAASLFQAIDQVPDEFLEAQP
ncbi:MAG: histidinol-phosphate aminotransferase family protein, partial [Phycisphaerales bacterium]|nr:histidinol-phosphate aminotransferase family protein [Phycisphaerales bacterium]